MDWPWILNIGDYNIRKKIVEKSFRTLGKNFQDRQSKVTRRHRTRDGENTKHTGFPENREKQKGKKHRRTDLVIFQNSQGLYAYVSFLFIFHNFPEIQYYNIFLTPLFMAPFAAMLVFLKVMVWCFVLKFLFCPTFQIEMSKNQNSVKSTSTDLAIF